MCSEIQDTLDKRTQGKNVDAKLLELTNKFYTIIPHDFGHKKPPLLDKTDILQDKLQLLNVRIVADQNAIETLSVSIAFWSATIRNSMI